MRYRDLEYDKGNILGYALTDIAWHDISLRGLAWKAETSTLHGEEDAQYCTI